MIESRGHDGIPVTSNRGVMVSEIGNAIIMYKSLDWICQRFPITEDEVFEVIDYYADTLEETINHKSIKFRNHGTAEDIDLETRMITDGVFYKVVQYGKIMYPEYTEFDDLYSNGLSALIADVYYDLERGVFDFETSPVHNAIYTGVRNELGDLPPDQVLANFNRQDYEKRKNL
jgi:uncharacterized protein (DUF433 family)